MTCHPEELLKNLHENLIPPNTCSRINIVKGKYAYYHYCCDKVDDQGWGCGYRTLQTLCSWALYNTKSKSTTVPSIVEVQKALVDMNDKPKTFIKSREWIGSLEVSYCMDYFFDVPCKLHHSKPSDSLILSSSILQEHFSKFGSPVMMGGDRDAASKCILGVAQSIITETDTYFLVLDPHCSHKELTLDRIINEGWLSWRSINSFDEKSFYNFCLPQATVV